MKILTAQSGFTLLETLIAFAILALFLTALYSTISDSLYRAGRARYAAEASLIAQSQLDLLRTIQQVQGATQETAIDGMRFRTRIDLLPVTTSPDQAGIQKQLSLTKIRLIVSWADQNRKYSLPTEAWLLTKKSVAQ